MIRQWYRNTLGPQHDPFSFTSGSSGTHHWWYQIQRNTYTEEIPTQTDHWVLLMPLDYNERDDAVQPPTRPLMYNTWDDVLNRLPHTLRQHMSPDSVSSLIARVYHCTSLHHNSPSCTRGQTAPVYYNSRLEGCIWYCLLASFILWAG